MTDIPREMIADFRAWARWEAARNKAARDARVAVLNRRSAAKEAGNEAK